MEDEKKHYWLYVLLLEDSKYYVGITAHKDPHVRIKQHFNGFMSARWTKKHKPTEIHEIIKLGFKTKREAEYYEKRRTLQYMKKYGYNNVRGADLNYSGRYFKIGYLYIRNTEIDYFNIAVVIILLLLAIILAI